MPRFLRMQPGLAAPRLSMSPSASSAASSRAVSPSPASRAVSPTPLPRMWSARTGTHAADTPPPRQTMSYVDLLGAADLVIRADDPVKPRLSLVPLVAPAMQARASAAGAPPPVPPRPDTATPCTVAAPHVVIQHAPDAPRDVCDVAALEAANDADSSHVGVRLAVTARRRGVSCPEPQQSHTVPSTQGMLARGGPCTLPPTTAVATVAASDHESGAGGDQLLTTFDMDLDVSVSTV